MLEIKRSIEQGWGAGGLYDILKQLQDIGIGVQGEVYFVDGNMGDDDPEAGKSWERPFKTLTYAMSVSQANMISGNAKVWASRNTIFCKADRFDEDLTTLCKKTDIIGVGSCDANPRPGLIGTHVISEATNNLTDYVGCHFYNFEFLDDGATSNWSIDHMTGIEFHNCVFVATASGTYGITVTDISHFRVINCDFRPGNTGTMFATAAILIGDTTTAYVEILNNRIWGTIGIDIDNTNAYNMLIANNFIRATTLCIDDESNDAVIVGNRMVTAAAKATLGNVIDYNAALAVDNILTGSDGTIHCPAETA